MSANTVKIIDTPHLLISLIPVIIVIFILFKWNLSYKYTIYALLRMIIQLLLVGYALNYIFNIKSGFSIFLILVLMLFISSAISIRTVSKQYSNLFFRVILALALGGGINLFLMTQYILEIVPWFNPKEIIPLAGMVFSNSLNGVSLAAERYHSEILTNKEHKEASRIALNTSLIPTVNSFLAVGIVSLPGMMTGQILSGTSPVLAIRYQIMILAIVLGSIGISVYIFLLLIKNCKKK